jgi:hypothetical protein
VKITTKQLRRLVDDTLKTSSQNPRNQNWGQTRIEWLFSNGESLDILAKIVSNFPGRERPRSREAHRHHLMLLRKDLGLSPGDIRRSRIIS